ncbi:MAG: sigma-70 family RNA polymerase sigma factor [Candidatus Omnitrophica bacterium]|nr:sigma-70 family RNA polymerase sigma factor [Candidatus Omnitrophota bacterium]
MDDLEFVKRCVGSDKQAQEEFIQKYCRLIFSCIHSFFRLKGLNPAAGVVEDLYQDILTSLVKDHFKKLSTYKGKNGASLASWLRQVVINRCIDHVRKSRPDTVSLEAPVAEGLTLSDIIPYRSRSVSEEASVREQLENLVDCIEQLDLDDKFFLELNLNHGLTLDHIKDFYRVTRGTVDMRRVRILERLRDCFKHKGYEVSV